MPLNLRGAKFRPLKVKHVRSNWCNLIKKCLKVNILKGLCIDYSKAKN